MLYAFKVGSATENAFEAGENRFRLCSPVIGLFVFGASIWFFNVYIDKVYKLTELQKAVAPASTEGNVDASGSRSDITSTPPPAANAGTAEVAKPAQQGNGSGAKPAQPGNTNISKPPVPAT